MKLYLVPHHDIHVREYRVNQLIPWNIFSIIIEAMGLSLSIWQSIKLFTMILLQQLNNTVNCNTLASICNHSLNKQDHS